MSTSKRVDRATRQQLILEATGDVFARQGFHDATTKELAAAAGVSEALLFQHFRSKQELFVAAMQARADAFAANLGEALRPFAEMGAEPEQANTVRVRLEELFRGLLDQMFSEPQLQRSLIIAPEAATVREAFYRHLLELEQPLLPLVENALGGACIDPRIAIRALFGQVFIFVVTEEWLGGKRFAPIDRDALPSQLAQLWLGLLGGPQRGGAANPPPPKAAGRKRSKSQPPSRRS